MNLGDGSIESYLIQRESPVVYGGRESRTFCSATAGHC